MKDGQLSLQGSTEEAVAEMDGKKSNTGPDEGYEFLTFTCKSLITLGCLSGSDDIIRTKSWWSIQSHVALFDLWTWPLPQEASVLNPKGY